MIPFIFFISAIMLILLVISFIVKLYPLAMISTIGLIVIGVYILGYGMEGITSSITLALGIVYLCMSFYILLNGTLEQIQKM